LASETVVKRDKRIVREPRLASVSNTGLSTGQYTNLTLTSMPENLISGITESSDASTVYPPTGTQSASYNNLNQN
jgi:hypothetical protein